MTGAAIVSTTVGSDAEARAMAHALVEARLAACVQIMPVTSVYRWEGAIEEAGEQLLLCKVAATDFAAIEAEIRARHGYAVPEIVMTEIVAGHGDYLDWLFESTTCGPQTKTAAPKGTAAENRPSGQNVEAQNSSPTSADS